MRGDVDVTRRHVTDAYVRACLRLSLFVLFVERMGAKSDLVAEGG